MEEPQTGWIKVNTDAVSNNKVNRAGWGIAARSWQGKVIAIWAYPSKSCSNARLEEALALRAAMIRAKQRGWKRVEFESNCKKSG